MRGHFAAIGGKLHEMSDYLEPCIRCNRRIDLIADDVNGWEAFDDGLVCSGCLTLEERWSIDADALDMASVSCVRSSRHPSRMSMWASSMPGTGSCRTVKSMRTRRRGTTKSLPRLNRGRSSGGAGTPGTPRESYRPWELE